jgi:UDP-N-acetyl-D-galactosamine dehydrogenase
MRQNKICVIGLGYVGLPLFLAFNKNKFDVCGYDTDKIRIKQLNIGIDNNNEVSQKDIKLNKSNFFTSKIDDIKSSNTFIFTLPTPINKNKKPDLSILKKATIDISKILKFGDTIIYESTVYPGLTEEILIPLIEKYSNLKLNNGFFCGYSPERINPGDKKKSLTNISKIVSGSNKKTLNYLYKIYNAIIKSKVIKASSIRHAEAAKIIENIQRDINISFFNELSMLFYKMGLNTREIIKLASTKWNFINFKPGLVGGHCIGVDPYYLTYKADKLNVETKMILAGRKVNDEMYKYVSNRFIKILKQNYSNIKKKKILILGFAFKENCSDFRNTQVIKIYNQLIKANLSVDVYDPLIDSKKVYQKYQLKMLKEVKKKYNGVIVCNNHDVFKYKFNKDKINDFLIKKDVIFDLKWFLDFNPKIETL